VGRAADALIVLQCPELTANVQLVDSGPVQVWQGFLVAWLARDCVEIGAFVALADGPV
jgi:hypothetical protein